MSLCFNRASVSNQSEQNISTGLDERRAVCPAESGAWLAVLQAALHSVLAPGEGGGAVVGEHVVVVGRGH